MPEQLGINTDINVKKPIKIRSIPDSAFFLLFSKSIIKYPSGKIINSDKHTKALSAFPHYSIC